MRVQHSNMQSIAFYVHCCCLGSIASACGVKLGGGGGGGGAGNRPCIHVECMLLFVFFLAGNVKKRNCLLLFSYWFLLMDYM